MAELADAADSKSAGTWYLGGSTPPPGTSKDPTRQVFQVGNPMLQQFTADAFSTGTYFDSVTIASAALPATTQFADPATTASSSNHRNPKSSMHSGKSGLMMMYPGITAPGI